MCRNTAEVRTVRVTADYGTIIEAESYPESYPELWQNHPL